MKTIEERILILEDESAIRNLAAEFADAATTADYDKLRLLWKDDGVFTINEPANVTKTGVDDICAHIKFLRDERDFFVQFVHSGVINVNGNQAAARWIIHEVGQGPSEKYYNNYGVFNDTMEKINGKWFFCSRIYDYMWVDFGKFEGKAINNLNAAKK
ncbi:nuclear transport factor 2 family protein [Flavobacterium sp.]|uniref:nuclear transport factor 2 family protein n=1 Tax=Flavobacterium sp. TaxID=239 RepID=UPI0031DD6E04